MGDLPDCEVCMERPASIVRQCSLPVPYSAAYCEACACSGIEPAGIVEATYALLAEGSIDPLEPEAAERLERSARFHGLSES